MRKKYRVGIIDNFHLYDDDVDDTFFDGFESIEVASEFAKRYVCGSVEELRLQSTSHDDLKSLWYSFGEGAYVENGMVYGSEHIDSFVGKVAANKERDWIILKPKSNVIYLKSYLPVKTIPVTEVVKVESEPIVTPQNNESHKTDFSKLTSYISHEESNNDIYIFAFVAAHVVAIVLKTVYL